MKLLCFIAVAMFAICVEGNKEMMVQMITDCQASVGATDADVAKFAIHAAPENQVQMCLISCVMDGLKVTNKGKLSKDGLTNMVSLMTAGDPVKMKMADELYDECSVMGGGSECESAAKICDCLKTNGVKKQIVFGI